MKHQLIYDVSTLRNRFANLFFRNLDSTDRLSIEDLLLKDFLLHRMHIIYCIPIAYEAFDFYNIDNVLDTLQQHTKHNNYQHLVRICATLDTPIRQNIRPNVEVFADRQIIWGAIVNDCLILELNK